MKKNEIKKTIEQVVRVEYIAEDGTVFYSEGECAEYEESALFVVSNQLKRLSKINMNQYTNSGKKCLICCGSLVVAILKSLCLLL